jgi:hypothetical protein
MVPSSQVLDNAPRSLPGLQVNLPGGSDSPGPITVGDDFDAGRKVCRSAQKPSTL